MKKILQNFKPFNKRSGYKSKPKDAESLFGSVLARHGIARQVQSSMVVQVANDALREILPLHARPDICAVWFQRGELLIGCRHPAAIGTAEEVVKDVEMRILRAYPDLSLERITVRFHPQAFEDKY